MVGHQVTDALAIVGLMATLFGTVCLSWGIFEKSWNLPRALLTALAMATVTAVLTAMLPAYYHPGNLRVLHVVVPGIVLSWVGWFLVFLFDVYAFYASTPTDDEYPQRVPLRKLLNHSPQAFAKAWGLRGIRWFVCLAVLLVGADVVLTLLLHANTSYVLLHLASLGLVAVTGLAEGILLPWVLLSLSRRNLQVAGFVLTLVGILTQFIQPVLDYLNVNVH
jgi:hypothetical protein